MLLLKGGACYRMQEKAVKIILMVCLGEEAKAGQGRGLDDFGRNKVGK